jgi:hypothetical protein
MVDKKQNLERIADFDDNDESEFEKFFLYIDTARSLPEKKQEALGRALTIKIVVEDKILPNEEIRVVSFAKLDNAINDGDITLEVNEEGKLIITFKSDDNCRIEEIARGLACSLKIKVRDMPILRCGIRKVIINSKRGVDVYYDNFDLGDDFEKELKEELKLLFQILR